MLVRIVYDVAVIMIPIKATKGKLGINFIPGLETVSIMACGSYELTDFVKRYLAVVEDHFQVLGLSVPFGEFDAGVVQDGFDPVLAHAAIPKDPDVRLNSLGLGIESSRAENKA